MGESNAHAIDLILEGCKMARILDENLPSWANQPRLLRHSCTHIIRAFGQAEENLSNRAQLLNLREPPPLLLDPVAGAAGTLDEVVVPIGPPGSSGEAEPPHEAGPPASAGHRGAPSSSSQRRPRRSDGGDRRVVRVAAPQMGNTEIPPDDCYTWRKYGQKNILHSRFPRSYFRCTHQKLYNCLAKRQVQRLDDDPNTFEVTYIGDHTCHFSSTAPSAPPPSSAPLPQQIVCTTAAAIIHPFVGMAPQLPREYFTINHLPGGGGSSSRAPHVDQQYLQHQLNVVDMADAMFNSGSSSRNSMDLIFPSMDDKWDSGEKRE